MVAVVVITILLVIYGRAADKEELARFYEEGFDCENGEIIHGSLVMNGVDLYFLNLLSLKAGAKRHLLLHLLVYFLIKQYLLCFGMTL